jgi:hypothetical protein
MIHESVVAQCCARLIYRSVEHLHVSIRHDRHDALLHQSIELRLFNPREVLSERRIGN